jgi:hypothetical protein
MTTKEKRTPSNCKLQKCRWNYIAPFENYQECIACEGNKKRNWKPTREPKGVEK